ncbi:hypothetical protein LCGC14_1610550 [marine sediment metagenome]|uniref:LamG-like jellyroll fold domain-containing protein n=1 Tax=marine sediment metagenome TaxID=412755 RepID=A0A0F9L8K0_9ZZZZ|nr:LamG domain-containing protein [Candidatus Scalindua sp.]
MRKLLFLFLLLTVFITNQVIAQDIRPSFNQGYARNALESKIPHLWKGIVGHWVPSLGVTGIKTLRDISGRRNHGTLESTMTLADWVIGGLSHRTLPSGYSLDYDGDDDFTSLDSAKIPNLVRGSICLWINPTVADGNDYIFDLQIPRITLLYFSSQRIIFDTVGVQVNTSSLAVQTLFLCATWNSDNEERFIYVDAVERASDTTAFDTSATPAGTVRIGARFSTATNFFNGAIGDVILYNRVLSPSEILEMYQNPSAMLELRRPVLAKAPPAGIPIFRRRIEGYCGKCHDNNMIVFKFDKPCERQVEVAFNER